MKSYQQFTLLSVVAMIIMIVITVTILPLAASASPVIVGKGTIANASEVVGNRFFENGTGIAYFNDGSTVLFNHSNTPENGFYYDNETIFYAGDIPEVGDRSNDNSSNNGVTQGANHNVIIPRQVEGSDNLLPSSVNRTTNITTGSMFQPSVVKIKVGDTVTWINEDYKFHSISSPAINPYINKNGDIPDFDLFTDSKNFYAFIESGETVTIQFNNPGGFHYHEGSGLGEGNAGTIIVEE